MGRRYGQHFLNDVAILDRIVEVAGLTPSDTVVEIGPGKGALTARLLAKGYGVVAIEIDPVLCETLAGRFKGADKFKLVRGDALAFDYGSLGRFKVVSNVPYYITTPIIFRLLQEGTLIESMTLTVQKEVGRRITAKHGGKDYGVLSVMVQYRCEARMQFDVPRGAFSPPPKVDSVVITLRTLPSPPVYVEKEELFFKVVRQSFSQRRKTLSNSLNSLVWKLREASEIQESLETRESHETTEPVALREILWSAGIDPSRRPETLSLAEFAKIANVLAIL